MEDAITPPVNRVPNSNMGQSASRYCRCVYVCASEEVRKCKPEMWRKLGAEVALELKYVGLGQTNTCMFTEWMTYALWCRDQYRCTPAGPLSPISLLYV